ncbi:MAG: BlaI/MecI/CopY family transcriptional regulator [Capsulimonas sp.]|uniref:BlaI/MecI/CopY family transcriptional regulator n=1 Tax=Capsulimonas sp. TaxID=2494211 RepID=UPI003263C02C
MIQRTRSLGAQELEALRHIADHGPLTVRQMTETYGRTHSLARTTLLTTMENLRKKGFVTRQATEAGFSYTAAQPKEQVLESLVQEFVQRSLGGSLAPFVAYITRAQGLTDAEANQLKLLVQDLEQPTENEEEAP